MRWVSKHPGLLNMLTSLFISWSGICGFATCYLTKMYSLPSSASVCAHLNHFRARELFSLWHTGCSSNIGKPQCSAVCIVCLHSIDFQYMCQQCGGFVQHGVRTATVYLQRSMWVQSWVVMLQMIRLRLGRGCHISQWGSGKRLFAD